MLRDLPRRSLAPNPDVRHKNNLKEIRSSYVLQEDSTATLTNQTLTALRKSNAPEREGPPPKDFVVQWNWS